MHESHSSVREDHCLTDTCSVVSPDSQAAIVPIVQGEIRLSLVSFHHFTSDIMLKRRDHLDLSSFLCPGLVFILLLLL